MSNLTSVAYSALFCLQVYTVNAKNKSCPISLMFYFILHETLAKLLAHFRVTVETHLGLPPETIQKAFITVPAYFTEKQLRSTKEAAECAGLDVHNILSESTAADIAYTWEKRESSHKKVLVNELSEGTFDVTISQLQANNVNVIVVDGNTDLGGKMSIKCGCNIS